MWDFRVTSPNWNGIQNRDPILERGSQIGESQNRFGVQSNLGTNIYECTLTLLPSQTYPQIWERSWLKAEVLGDEVCKPFHFATVEDVELFKLHPTFMSYLYEVFQHLQLLCIDIWLHTHKITTTDVPQIW